MPDTGAPWNIPYVAGTDLVSDWPADSLALANAIDAGLDAAGNAGIGSNVVQTVKTDTFSTTSASFVDATGMTVTITPTSASSKILVNFHFVTGNSGAAYVTVNLLRGSTNIAQAVGGSDPATFNLYPGGTGWGDTLNLTFVDSPATTSATTYKIQIAQIGGGTVFVGRPANDDRRSVSTITAIEVAA